MQAYGNGQVGFQVFSVTATQLTDMHCVCLKAYFHYGGCMLLHGIVWWNRKTARISVSLATQCNATPRTAVMEMSLNGRVTRHWHTWTAAVSHAHNACQIKCKMGAR